MGIFTLTATKQFTFDCAHMLSGHEGECKNLHGHTYQLFVEVALSNSYPLIEAGPAAGMIVDFKDLKKYVQPIIDKLDHAFVCWKYGNEVEQALKNLAKHHQLKVLELDFRPTAENLVVYLGQEIQENFPADSETDLFELVVTGIKLYETPTSFAEYKLFLNEDGE